MRHEDPELAAEVVLRPRNGPLTGREQITAATLDSFQPAAATFTRAGDYFRSRGFAVSPGFGISFTITGPRTTFEREFGEVASDARELPLDRLPADVATLVHAVTFTPPVDYGPFNP
jgi:hypothetical protein